MTPPGGRTVAGRYDMVPAYTLADFKHWFLPREGVIYSFVVEVGPASALPVALTGILLACPLTAMVCPTHRLGSTCRRMKRLAK